MKILGAEILTEEEKKKKYDEILAQGKGPLREMPVETPKKSGRFGDFMPLMSLIRRQVCTPKTKLKEAKKASEQENSATMLKMIPYISSI